MGKRPAGMCSALTIDYELHLERTSEELVHAQIYFRHGLSEAKGIDFVTGLKGFEMNRQEFNSWMLCSYKGMYI